MTNVTENMIPEQSDMTGGPPPGDWVSNESWLAVTVDGRRGHVCINVRSYASTKIVYQLIDDDHPDFSDIDFWQTKRYIFTKPGLMIWGGGESSPVTVEGNAALAGKRIASVAAHWAGSYIVVCSDGSLVGWGSNASGILGVGDESERPEPTPVGLGGALTGKRVVAVELAQQHALALCDDGTVASWGENRDGQLGNGVGTWAPSLVPVAVDSFCSKALQKSNPNWKIHTKSSHL